MAPDTEERVAALDRRVSKIEWWVESHEEKASEIWSLLEQLQADISSIKSGQRAVFWIIVGSGATIIAHSLGWLEALKMLMGAAS